METWAFITDEVVPYLNQGLWVSIQLIIPSALGGILLGVIVGALRVYGKPVIKVPANIYANLFRGTPLLVQLFIIYFGLAKLGLRFPPFTAAVLGFVLCSGAYHSEYIRGGLQAIKDGQLKAAKALGFSTLQSVVSIIMPQAFRRALPGCGNEIIYLIKYTSLAYIITCVELTGEGKILAAESFRYTEVFLVVGLYYLVLVTLATWGLRKLESRLRIPGFEQS
jgi:polar amino acid transport system permease protein